MRMKERVKKWLVDTITGLTLAAGHSHEVVTSIAKHLLESGLDVLPVEWFQVIKCLSE